MNPRYDRDKGMQMFDTVYCGDVPIPTAPGESRFIDYMLETLFGTLWADQDSLSIRDRRLLLIGAIAAIGDETTLAIQTRSALKRGELDPSQLDSISMFLTQYVGYPLGSRLHRVFSQLRAEIASAGGIR